MDFLWKVALVLWSVNLGLYLAINSPISRFFQWIYKWEKKSFLFVIDKLVRENKE